MHSLLNSLKTQKISQNNNSFLFQHLPTGLGTTIGNCLRRILIENLYGIAIWGIKITDKKGIVKSNFTTLTGVHETTIDLISKLKEVIFKFSPKHKELKEIYLLKLNINNQENKEYIITAADFQSTEIKVVNPKIYLATLAPHSSLQIELYCRYNWGYLSAQTQKHLLTKIEDNKNENIIVLDSSYSPIKKVFFEVKLVVADLETEEEELNLVIDTNGSLEPKEALLKSLETLGEIKENLVKEISSL